MNKRTLKSYRIWKAMKSRCYAPSQTKGNYKKFGIKVCDRWLHDYNAFIADMGEMPGENYSIERIDVTKDYCPENCKWIPQIEQPKNRANSIFICYQGETKCLKDWAKILNIKYSTLYSKFRKGYSFESIIKGAKA